MKFELKLVGHPVMLYQTAMRLPTFMYHASNTLCDEAQLSECSILLLEIAKADLDGGERIRGTVRNENGRQSCWFLGTMPSSTTGRNDTTQDLGMLTPVDVAQRWRVTFWLDGCLVRRGICCSGRQT